MVPATRGRTMSRRKRVCEGQYVLPEFDPAQQAAYRACVHPVNKLMYVDVEQTEVACVTCGEVLGVPELPWETRVRLR